MRNYLHFKMWGQFREDIIFRHQFYIEQARERLLAQFLNIEKEVEQYEKDYLEKILPHFDPDKHYDEDLYEQVQDNSINFYEMLEDMESRTKLSVIAGMFHEWDKQLRDWMVNEIFHWHTGQKVKEAVWRVSFKNNIDLLEACDWPIKSKSYYKSLCRCELIVNVYKHGDGRSFNTIKKDHPEFIETLLGNNSRDLEYSDYTNLIIKEHHIDEFSDAIVGFWKDIPDNIYKKEHLSFPSWFEDAYKTDL